MPKRATSTSFGRGRSGNPAGRPKSKVSTQHLRDEARAHGIDAIRTLVAAMHDAEAKLADVIRAAQVVLEYGFGRPGTMEPEQTITTVGAELVELFRRPPALASCPAELPRTEHEQPIAQGEATAPEASGQGQHDALAV